MRQRGSRPVHLVAHHRPTYREATWAAIRYLREFSLPQLADAARVPNDGVNYYLTGLVAAGYVSRIDGDAGAPGRVLPRYRLERDTGAEAPRVNKDGTPMRDTQATEQMWRAMKIVGEFTPRELAIAASLPECVVSEKHAREYTGYLLKAGYLAKVKAGVRGSESARLRFLASKNSGPKPPMVQRVRQVFDPNLKQIVWQEPSKDPLEALV